MPVKVLYIAGFGHCGSTVFGDVLGSHPAIFHGGEIFHLSRRLRSGGVCDCGSDFGNCSVWGEVLASMIEGGVQEDSLHDGSWRDDPDSRARLYLSLAEVTGATFVLDGSKRPAFGRMLASTPRIDLGVIHLVRDGRANVLSRLRRGRQRALRDAGSVQVLSALAADSRKWSKVNLESRTLRELVDRHAQVRYEDFASNPADSLDAILAYLDLPGGFPDGPSNDIRIDEKHTVFGNRDHRNLGGSVAVTLDERWLDEMSTAHFLVATSIQALTLSRFGYPLTRQLPHDLGRPATFA